MRTKEKFYENLSNFHVSKEKEIERFEFQDVKTLDTLAAKAKSKTAAVTKAVDAELDADFAWQDQQKIAEKQLAKTNSAQDNFDKVAKENRKRLDDATKSIKKADDLLQKEIEKRDKLTQKFNKKEAEAKSILSDGKSLVSQMESGISTFINSAKALGVDVSGKVSKYNSIKDKLELEIRKGE